MSNLWGWILTTIAIIVVAVYLLPEEAATLVRQIRLWLEEIMAEELEKARQPSEAK